MDALHVACKKGKCCLWPVKKVEIHIATRYGPNRPAAAIGGGDFLVLTLLVASEAAMAFIMEELFRF